MVVKKLQFSRCTSEDQFFSDFFKSLKQNEVFTFSQSFDFQEVTKIAKKYGVNVEYCEPGTEEYKNNGCFACKVK